MTTYSPPASEIARRVAVGDCSAAQGYDGVPELAASAFEALLAAPWSVSAAAPSMPVHDNGQTSNKTIPAGDAWKCGYGYDAAARTERSAAGAACYSLPLPPDALDATNAEGVAAVTSISVRVIGDRYLDGGAVLYAAITASPEPPAVALMMSAAARTAPLCATSDQTDSGGAALPPNRRAGVRADAALDLSESPLAPPEGATAAYLHLCLALADYTTARGAWIEGGAMLAPDTVAVGFSRGVSEAAQPAATCVPLDLEYGVVDVSRTTGNAGSRRQDCYVCSFPEGREYEAGHVASASDRANSLIAVVLQGCPCTMEDRIFQNTTLSFGIGERHLSVVVASRCGRVPAGKWSGVRFETPIVSACDAILHLYAAVGSTLVSASAAPEASMTEIAEICLTYDSVMAPAAYLDDAPSGAFSRLVDWRGGAGVERFVDRGGATAPFQCSHVGAARLAAGVPLWECPFRDDFETRSATPGLFTLIAQLYPLGPGGGVEEISRTEVVLETLSFSGVVFSGAQDDGTFNYRIGADFNPAAYAEQQGGQYTSVKIVQNRVAVMFCTEVEGSDGSQYRPEIIVLEKSFLANGRMLHFDTFGFGEGVFNFVDAPSLNNYIGYELATTNPPSTTWKVPATPWCEKTVSVYEMIDGQRVDRGTATVKARIEAQTVGGVAVTNALYWRVVAGQRWSVSPWGGSNTQWTLTVQVDYYHQITMPSSSASSADVFEFPEVSLIPAQP